MDPSDPQLRHYQNQYPHQDQSHPYDPSQSQSYEAYYAAYHHHHHQQQQHYEPSAYHQPSAVVDPTTPQIHHGYSAQPDQHHPAPAAELYGGGAHHHHHHQLYPYPVSHHYPVVEQGQVAVRHGGGARRGSGPFRGGSRRGSGRGNPSHRPPPSFRGRGRGRGRMGRGGGRKPHQPSADPQPTDSSTVGLLLEPGREQPAPPQSAAATRKKERPNPLLTWCDICRVDCNSLEILQQHKNGKRHKKTVQRFEEIQRQQKLYGELQGTPLPSTELSSAGVGEEANIVSSGPENIPNSDTLNKMPISVDSESDVNKGQTAEGHLEPSKVEEPPHATNEPSSVLPISEVPHAEGGSTGQPRNDVPRGGMKRKLTKSGRGGKRLKSNDQARGRAPERSRVCTLCNVMCETLTVFESHVAGKKHISKLKRFQGHGSVYGPITVYIPPNQPSAYPAQGQEPLFFGLKSHEMVQAEMYGGMNGLQPEYYGHQHVGEVGWNPHVALLETSHNGGKVGWNPHITLPDSSQAVIQNDIVPGTTEEPETTEHEGLGINVEPDAAGDEVLPSAIGKDIVTLPEVATSFRE